MYVKSCDRIYILFQYAGIAYAPVTLVVLLWVIAYPVVLCDFLVTNLSLVMISFEEGQTLANAR